MIHDTKEFFECGEVYIEDFNLLERIKSNLESILFINQQKINSLDYFTEESKVEFRTQELEGLVMDEDRVKYCKNRIKELEGVNNLLKSSIKKLDDGIFVERLIKGDDKK